MATRLKPENVCEKERWGHVKLISIHSKVDTLTFDCILVGTKKTFIQNTYMETRYKAQ